MLHLRPNMTAVLVVTLLLTGCVDLGRPLNRASDARVEPPNDAVSAHDAEVMPETGDEDGAANDRPEDAGDLVPDVDVRLDDAPVDRGADGPPAACGSGPCKRVFVTLQGVADGAIGGAAQADVACQSRAAGQGLGGTWRAWVSDSRSSPATRFVRAAVPYRLLDGTVIANNWTDLVDGTLEHAIDRYETGAVIAAAVHEIWTGTATNGTATTAHCDDWTNRSENAPLGGAGVASERGVRWTSAFTQFCNRSGLRVYCFEQ